MPKVTDAHRERRRRQILAAAIACFAREGFHRTTMQDIVREARLSPGAIYGYFSGKDAIVEAIAADRHRRELTLIEAAGEGDLVTALRRLAEQFFGLLGEVGERERRRVGVQIWAEALRNPRLLRLTRAGVDRPRAMLARLIRQAQAQDNPWPGIDPDAAARLMIALFQGFILQQAWDPRVRAEPHLAAIETALAALAPATRSGPAGLTRGAQRSKPERKGRRR